MGAQNLLVVPGAIIPRYAPAYKASKLAFSDVNRNLKLDQSIRSPYGGVATGLGC